MFITKEQLTKQHHNQTKKNRWSKHYQDKLFQDIIIINTDSYSFKEKKQACARIMKSNAKPETLGKLTKQFLSQDKSSIFPLS